jgi:hypothetical protein
MNLSRHLAWGLLELHLIIWWRSLHWLCLHPGHFLRPLSCRLKCFNVGRHSCTIFVKCVRCLMCFCIALPSASQLIISIVLSSNWFFCFMYGAGDYWLLYVKCCVLNLMFLCLPDKRGTHLNVLSIKRMVVLVQTSLDILLPYHWHQRSTKQASWDNCTNKYSLDDLSHTPA